MTKYGKIFRKIQLSEWKGRYFDYKRFKQFIKRNNPDNIFPIQKDEKKEKDEKDKEKENDNNVYETLEEKIKYFTDELDKEIKRVYVFFSNKEKKLYKDINKCLHQKEDYAEYELNEYLTQFNLLLELSAYNHNLSIFIYYNLKAVLKILKKFDKKIVGKKNKEKHILFNYIQKKLEEQNSDILYLFRFKMIDEVNALMENLIKKLKDQLKINKKKFKREELLNDDGNNIISINSFDNENNENTADLIEKKSNENNSKGLFYNDVYNNVEIIYKKIKKYMTNIDLFAMNTIKLFRPWKQFLRISSDIGSRLMQINQEGNEIDDDYSKRKKSLALNFNFSTENKFNIMITLFHGFFYCFSFSVIIPTYTDYIDDFTDEKYFYGLLMMMAPIGALFGFLYETHLFKRSTKIPYILSIVEIIVGNLFYIFAKKLEQISFLFIGRFLIGISNLRTHNKMYIINYLSKKDTNFYLTMFHGASILGSFTGFFINVFYDSNTFSSFETFILTEKTIGSLINLVVAIAFLIFVIIKYSEAKSDSFNRLTVSQAHKFNKDDNLSLNATLSEDGHNMSIDIQRDSIMVENIDAELEIFNKKNKYDDTNLVTRSVNEIAEQEKENLKALIKAYFVFIFIVFTTKYINEAIVIYFGLNLIKENPEFLKEHHWVHGLVLSGAYLLVILCVLALSKKVECTRDKFFLIIILSLNLINCSLLIFFSQNKIEILIICSSLAIVLSNLIQKTASHYFFNIIPSYYILCRIQGNILINIITTLGRIVSSGLLIAYEKNQEYEIVDEFFNAVYYIIMTLLSLLSLLFYCIYYSDIRVKAISRIIKNDNKNEIQIATDV
jgi:hypothetical protein